MTIQLPPNPFPGMNPYLERRDIWPGVHLLILAELQGFLAPRLQPDYVVTVGERVHVIEEPGTNGNGSVRVPDVAVVAGTAEENRESVALERPSRVGAIAVELPSTELIRNRYLEVRRVDDNQRVVAVIELLSPTNKSGDGRREYLSKRSEVLYSSSHLVEIDLLRAGRPMPLSGDVPSSRYRILVANARRTEPMADLYPFGIRQPIPDFVMPLSKESESVGIDLNGIFNTIYSARYFNLLIDYNRDPEPPLSDADRVWIDQLLRDQGLRKLVL